MIRKKDLILQFIQSIETSQNNITSKEDGVANDKTIESLNSADKLEIDKSKTDDANEKNNK